MNNIAEMRKSAGRDAGSRAGRGQLGGPLSLAGAAGRGGGHGNRGAGCCWSPRHGFQGNHPRSVGGPC